MKYLVYVPITGHAQYYVEADSPADAIELVALGDCDCGNDTTEEDTDTEGWEVELVDKAGICGRV